MPVLSPLARERLLASSRRRATPAGASRFADVLHALCAGFTSEESEPTYNLVVALSLTLHTYIGRLAFDCARLKGEIGHDDALEAVERSISMLTALVADLKTPKHPARAQILDASRASRN